MTFSRLAGLSPVGKSARNGVDYTYDLLGDFLFMRSLSLMSLLLVSLCTLVFHSSSVCFVVPMLLLSVSSRPCSYLVVVRSLNKLG